LRQGSQSPPFSCSGPLSHRLARQSTVAGATPADMAVDMVAVDMVAVDMVAADMAVDMAAGAAVIIARPQWSMARPTITRRR